MPVFPSLVLAISCRNRYYLYYLHNFTERRHNNFCVTKTRFCKLVESIWGTMKKLPPLGIDFYERPRRCFFWDNIPSVYDPNVLTIKDYILNHVGKEMQEIQETMTLLKEVQPESDVLHVSQELAPQELAPQESKLALRDYLIETCWNIISPYIHKDNPFTL